MLHCFECRHLVGVWIGGVWDAHFPESEKYFSEAGICSRIPRNCAERAIFAKFRAPKFENSEPAKMQFHTPQPFHTPTRLPPSFESGTRKADEKKKSKWFCQTKFFCKTVCGDYPAFYSIWEDCFWKMIGKRLFFLEFFFSYLHVLLPIEFDSLFQCSKCVAFEIVPNNAVLQWPTP